MTVAGGTYSLDFNSDSGPIVSQDFDIDGFDEIRIVGGWDVLVIAEDEFRVSVDAGEKAVDDLVVKKQGDALYLGQDYRGLKNSHEFHGASATVYMPVLKDVDVDGAVNLNIEGFTGERVSFRLDGAGQIIGEDCVFEDLKVRSNGAVNFDFSGSDTENVDVNIDGAGNVELNMTGGRPYRQSGGIIQSRIFRSRSAFLTWKKTVSAGFQRRIKNRTVFSIS